MILQGKITLILNIGGSSNGINALTYSIVRATLASNNRVFGAKFGIEGFIQGDVIPLLLFNLHRVTVSA